MESVSPVDDSLPEIRPGERLAPAVFPSAELRPQRRVERMLIFWTCAMILASGFLGFVAGRYVRLLRQR
jgi:hypothetical protein